MPFKKKPYRKVGDIYIPRPPTGATHILFQTQIGKRKQRATVAIKSVDTLLGSVGTIKYLKLNPEIISDFQYKSKIAIQKNTWLHRVEIFKNKFEEILLLK